MTSLDDIERCKAIAAKLAVDENIDVSSTCEITCNLNYVHGLIP